MPIRLIHLVTALVLLGMPGLATLCTGTDGPGMQATPAAGSPAETGVPVTFTLAEPGYVTLVIETPDGNRVRNLIADTYFEAGTHTVQWDGFDEGEPVRFERQEAGARYDVQRSRVEPGRYVIRGLMHDGIRMRYAMPVQSPGQPAWHTRDGEGAWLADHTPPTSVLFLPDGSAYGEEPQVMVGAPIAETGHALMWLTLDGRKLYGTQLNWEGAYALARDDGPARDASVTAYSATVRRGKELSVRAHLQSGDVKTLVRQELDQRLGGDEPVYVAAYNQTVAVSLTPFGRVAFIDGRGRLLGTADLPSPRGIATDAAGRLYVVQESELWRYTVDWTRGTLGPGERVVGAGLGEPHGLMVGADGRLYVSVWGDRHQVQVRDAEGTLLHTLGTPGGEEVGTYDPTQMRYPNGMALDSRGRLWVAEVSYAPKRLSLWDADGGFLRAFYGPPKYGGGGIIDPRDSTAFYYATGGRANLRDEDQRGKAGIRFDLDWSALDSEPDAVYMHMTTESRIDNLPGMGPEQPVYREGRRYLVNVFNQAFQGMRGVIGLWRYDADDVARLKGVIGYHGRNRNYSWTELNRPEMRAAWPPSADPNDLFYVWTDQNDDGRPQPEEVQYQIVKQRGTVYVGPDLSITTSQRAHVAAPTILDNGVPIYDLSSWTEPRGEGQADADVLTTPDGWTILAGGPLQGFGADGASWTYHSQWLRRARSPQPGAPGQLVETSRVLGYPVAPRSGEAGPVWALNNDKGSIYLFTSDGLFLDELGGDARTAPRLRAPELRPGDVVEDITFDEEHFWPTISQIDESGTIYVTAGKEFSALFRLEGWEHVRRLASQTIEVTAAMLADATEREVRADQQTDRTLRLGARRAGRVDGDLREWAGADWVTVDERRGIEAAVAIVGSELHVAYRTGDPTLLNNSGAQGLPYLFATGGALDLMLRTRPQGTVRDGAQEGDVRLIVTRLGDPQSGPVAAVRMVQVGRAGGDAVTYTSPIGEVTFDSVTDVSDVVRLAQEGGTYEVAIPLRALGINRPPTSGQTLGDVGVLLGDGAETTARVYWSNKTNTMVSDIPTEARLQPRTWGTWTVRD